MVHENSEAALSEAEESSSLEDQEGLYADLEELLSKNEDEPILVLLKKISDPDKKNEFITRFVEKYISEKKYIGVGELLDQCKDKQLKDTLANKVWAAMDSDK